MACATCGTEIDPNLDACPTCGTPTRGAASAGAPVGGGPAGGAGGPAPSYGYGQPVHPSGLSSELRGWGIAAHLGGLGGALLTVTLLGFVGPLAIWLAKRDEHPFVDHHAKESLNFQLTVLTVIAASVVLAIPAAILGVLTLGIGFVLLILVGAAAAVAWFVLPIIGAVKAANGEAYRYPLTIRYVR